MVCDRCKAAVKAILESNGCYPLKIELGEVQLTENVVSQQQSESISNLLQGAGFELIDDRKGRIIEQIKTVIINLIHYSDEPPKEKYSEVLARAIHYDYSYLSKLFSEVEGITIEHYIIRQKAEKIKEYIVYDELTLSEIADRMGYRSVAHLSSQFKKATGLSPSHFKAVGVQMRKSLDTVSH